MFVNHNELEKNQEKSWWEKRKYLIYKLTYKMITPEVTVKEIIK